VEATYHAVEDPKFATQMREIEETIVDSVQQGLQEAKRLQEIKSKKERKRNRNAIEKEAKSNVG